MPLFILYFASCHNDLLENEFALFILWPENLSGIYYFVGCCSLCPFAEIFNKALIYYRIKVQSAWIGTVHETVTG